MKTQDELREYQRAWRAANKDRVREHNLKKMAYISAWRKANPDRVRTAQSKYRETHTEKERRRHAIYREGNREKIRVDGRRYYKENAERVLQTSRAWLQNNPVRAAKTRRDYQKAHPELGRRMAKRFREAHPEYVIEQRNLRRARKIAAATGTNRAEYRKFVKFIKAAAVAKCHWCRKPVARGKRHIDHIIPLARGGADDVGNLCCSCGRCNCSKHTKLPEQFTGQHEIIFTPANP